MNPARKALLDRLTDWRRPGDLRVERAVVVDYEVRDADGQVVEVSYHLEGEEPNARRVYFGT